MAAVVRLSRRFCASFCTKCSIKCSTMPRSDLDVLIAGGGFAGLTLAIALREALGDRFAVAVADPGLGRGAAAAFAARLFPHRRRSESTDHL